ncbi:unnamed protein product [Closterium sp. Naga37s-1]|nr:unnamed protein product [Closterium sp. Naga37s-1]
MWRTEVRYLVRASDAEIICGREGGAARAAAPGRAMVASGARWRPSPGLAGWRTRWRPSPGLAHALATVTGAGARAGGRRRGWRTC